MAVVGSEATVRRLTAHALIYFTRAQMDALVNTIDTEFELQVQSLPPLGQIGKGPLEISTRPSTHRHTAVLGRRRCEYDSPSARSSTAAKLSIAVLCSLRRLSSRRKAWRPS